jgi:hypothetical protein
MGWVLGICNLAVVFVLLPMLWYWNRSFFEEIRNNIDRPTLWFFIVYLGICGIICIMNAIFWFISV